MIGHQIPRENRLMVRDPISELSQGFQLSMQLPTGAFQVREGLMECGNLQPLVVAVRQKPRPEPETQLRDDVPRSK